MKFKDCKVYNDGSHFIAIRHTESNTNPRYRRPPEELIEVVEERAAEEVSSKPCKVDKHYEKGKKHAVLNEESAEITEGVKAQQKPPGGVVKVKRMSTRTEEFLRLYRQTAGMSEKKRRKYIVDKLEPYFKSRKEAYDFVDWRIECRKRADIIRRIRCERRASLHEFNYFCTFTYDSKKLNEQDFQKKLLNTLRHFSSRKGWKYMGAWERGSDTNRLHFHALVSIPPDKMSGELVDIREYDIKQKRMIEYTENTFFLTKFGRNSFDAIDGVTLTVTNAIGYILKYIEKDGGRVICSRGLKTFIQTDIDGSDIITRLYDFNDTKYILFDDFTVYKDGEKLGAFSPGLLSHAKLVN